MVVADVILVMTKVTEHKLNGSNYLDWSKTNRVYLRSIDKIDHIINDPPIDNTRQTWMREDTRLFLQIRNSINSEAVQEFGVKKSTCDHSVLYKQSEASIILLLVYVDIVITRNDTVDGKLFEDLEKYRSLVGKLNYLQVTHPDVAYSVSVIGQVPRVIGDLLQDIVFLLEKIWSHGKARIWMYQLLSEIGLKSSLPAKLWRDNQVALHIASNLVFHERTKHIEIDCHFVCEKIQQEFIPTRYVKTKDQLGDIFTKALQGP
ncbi:Uncharacterized protein TCM_040357 [Theobroma cacao]|uniref:Cysteine-rich RLK (RECEPTOR-like protein kinase) 8 n=1 Tax=Theobroma cacao TaxID=3641 RepID=A0A061GTD3_THECC|nr:Uncharacterized protein TCM_040357 [Theobroma cacao]